MKDIVVLAALVLAFATLVTLHVSLVVRLVIHARPRWLGLLALLVPPLAPVWAYRQGFRVSAAAWVAAVVVYAVARIAAEM